MKNNWNFDDYQVTREIKDSYKILPSLLFILIIGIIIILYKFQFFIYWHQSLIKVDDYYSLLVDSNRVNYLEQNTDIYIKQKKYSYEIKKIDSEYTSINGTIYQTVYLDLPNYQTDAVITECQFLFSKKTIIENIMEFMKGEEK